MQFYSLRSQRTERLRFTFSRYKYILRMIRFRGWQGVEPGLSYPEAGLMPRVRTELCKVYPISQERFGVSQVYEDSAPLGKAL
jgi:hypothetical protein